MYRKRFGLTHHPLPKNVSGKAFFDKGASHIRFERAFKRLCHDPGLGVLTAEAGVGKTCALRLQCAQLPRPDYQVLYLCDTCVSPLDLYRTLAEELGVRPSHRRAQLWTDIKKTLLHLVDERGTRPLLVLDEAQHLSDRFLIDLGGFLNFAFDSRDLLTLWLCGLPALERTLRMRQHAPLLSRVAEWVRLESPDRDTFLGCIDHGLRAAGATQKLIADPALELLYRASRGNLRTASLILRKALQEAHDRDQNFVDELLMEVAVDQVVQRKAS